MTEIDTSSYPKATMPVGPLDMAQKLGNIQQQKLGIDQAKLDQANQGLTYLTRAMTSLGPDASKEQYKAVGQNAVDMGLASQDMLHLWDTQVDNAPDGPTFFKQAISAVQSHQQQLENYVGKPGSINNGQTEIPTRTPGFTGAPIATGMPVQMQAPPTTPTFNQNNQPQLLGAQPPQVAPGSVAGPTPFPVERPAMPTTGPTGPTVRRTDMEPTSFDNRFPQPRGPAAGTAPMFEEGKKQLVEDQALAAQKMTAVKPAILAMKLLPGLRSGPGTEPFQKAVAFLKANNVITTAQENDPTVVYQEANKYLSQYLKGRGGRSDADLEAAAKSSPNVGTQLNPALQNLTRSAVAQDRIEAARSTAFEGNDYSKYGQHRATFPQSIDERAFSLDLLPANESKKMVDQMHDKYKKNPKSPEALKFFHSLDIAKKQGFFNGSEE